MNPARLTGVRGNITFFSVPQCDSSVLTRSLRARDGVSLWARFAYQPSILERQQA